LNSLRKLMLRRAAKRYAGRLPAALVRSWGRADFYTFGQVRTALTGLRLECRYDAVAYAGCVTEATYLANAASLPLVLPYDQARAMLMRYLSKSGPATYAFEPMSNEQAATTYGLGVD